MKGRGLLRFTGRSRSRSLTPPHWRRAVEERVRKGNMRHDDGIFNKSAGDLASNSIEKAATNGKNGERETKRRDESNDDAKATKRARSRSRSRSRNRHGGDKERSRKHENKEDTDESRAVPRYYIRNFVIIILNEI